MEPYSYQYTIDQESQDLFEIDYDDIDWNLAGLFDNEQESYHPDFEMPFPIVEPAPQLITSVPPVEVAEFPVPQQMIPVEVAELQVQPPPPIGPLGVAEFPVAQQMKQLEVAEFPVPQQMEQFEVAEFQLPQQMRPWEVAEFQLPQQMRPWEVPEFLVPQQMRPLGVAEFPVPPPITPVEITEYYVLPPVEPAELHVPPSLVPLPMTLGQEAEQPGTSYQAAQPRAKQCKRNPPKWQEDLEIPGLTEEEKLSIKKAKYCKEYRDNKKKEQEELRERVEVLRLSREQDRQEIMSNDEMIRALEKEVERIKLEQGLQN